MFYIGETDCTFAVAAALVICFFALQLLLCYRAKSLPVKLLPLCPPALLALAAVGDFLDIYGGKSSGGFINMDDIFGFLLLIAAALMLLGSSAAFALKGALKLIATLRKQRL